MKIRKLMAVKLYRFKAGTNALAYYDTHLWLLNVLELWPQQAPFFQAFPKVANHSKDASNTELPF
jgi:hypothetical protein